MFSACRCVEFGASGIYVSIGLKIAWISSDVPSIRSFRACPVPLALGRHPVCGVRRHDSI